jgi:hypothetical protein
VQSRVAFSMYFLGVDSLRVVQLRIVLMDSGFTSRMSNDTIQAFA